jgi:branched-chain amino acid transport system ATP-binding protein
VVPSFWETTDMPIRLRSRMSEPKGPGLEPGGRPSDAPLLEADALSVGYGLLPVLRDVSVEVRPGEIVAILGPNGAGKTSLLMGLSGGLSPMSGEVRWRGRRTTAPMHSRCRDGLAFVPEERSIIPSMSAADNLRLGRYGIEEALSIMPELKVLLKRPAGLLSGGEQQMLTLARALAQRPTVLLADELSLGLAPLIVKRLLSAVRAAADRGIGAIIVEQKVKDVLDVADRAVVLGRGQVVMSGTADEIRRRLPELEAAYFAGGKHETQPSA